MRRCWTALSIALLFVFVLGGAVVGDASAGEIVAVVNEANPTTEMSLHRLRLLYALYQRSWHGGIRVRIVVPAPGSNAMEFLVSEVFRKGEDWEVDRFYIQAVFQQRIPMRPEQRSSEAAIALVRSSAGAIAIVDRDEIDEGSGLRILEIVDDR